MSKKENVTGQLSWQGKAQTHCKNQRFFQTAITGDHHNSSDLIWKVTFGFVKKKIIYRKIPQVILSTEIQVFVFDHRQISKTDIWKSRGF